MRAHGASVLAAFVTLLLALLLVHRGNESAAGSVGSSQVTLLLAMLHGHEIRSCLGSLVGMHASRNRSVTCTPGTGITLLSNDLSDGDHCGAILPHLDMCLVHTAACFSTPEVVCLSATGCILV